jgi:HD-GYP domain-containing protein (c-di-GMP phosphodiesterase class II)
MVRLTKILEQQHENYVALIKTLICTLEARDEYTAAHSDRVGHYTKKLAERLGWDSVNLEHALFAGFVHDVGKIGILDRYLLKAGALSSEESRILEQHTIIGERLLSGISEEFVMLRAAIRSHHERWDGLGYPDGLLGENIPLIARMVSISNVFDQMTMAREFGASQTWAVAFQVLHNRAGSQFDPNLVPLFVEIMSE